MRSVDAGHGCCHSRRFDEIRGLKVFDELSKGSLEERGTEGGERGELDLHFGSLRFDSREKGELTSEFEEAEHLQAMLT